MRFCYWSQLARKGSKAVNTKNGKQNIDTAKSNLPPGQIINQRSISCLFSATYRKRISQIETTEITDLFSHPKVGRKWHSSEPHYCPLCLSSLRRSRDVTTDFYILNTLNSYILFICLTSVYLTIIFYIYLFIYFYLLSSAVHRPPSAVRFHVLQTPTAHSPEMLE